MSPPTPAVVTDQLVTDVGDHLNATWPFLLNDGLQHEVAREALEAAATHTAERASAPNAVLDWTDPSGWLAGLDEDQRGVLADVLRAQASADNETSIVQVVREVWAHEDDASEVLAVLFGVSAWDNGFLLTSEGSVIHADGSVRQVEFEDLDAVLTHEYGVRGPHFGLAVDLRTGRVLTDDVADNLPTLLPRPTVPGCVPDELKETPW